MKLVASGDDGAGKSCGALAVDEVVLHVAYQGAMDSSFVSACTARDVGKLVVEA